MDKILFDFIAANTQAKSLEDTAVGIRTLADRKLETLIQQLAAAWQGEASAAYLAKLRQLQTDIAATAEDLNAVAENLRFRSRRLYEAERAAADIAATSAGGGGSMGGR